MAEPDTRDALRRAIAHEHRLYADVRRHERLATRWEQRAALALRRGEPALAAEALARQATESRAVQEYQALCLAQSEAIQRAKRTLRPSGVLAAAPPDRTESELQRLAVEDRLERDLAALKARLSRGSEAPSPAAAGEGTGQGATSRLTGQAR